MAPGVPWWARTTATSPVPKRVPASCTPSLVVNVTVSVNGSAMVVDDGASVSGVVVSATMVDDGASVCGVVVSATVVDVSEDPDTGDVVEAVEGAEVVDDRASSPGPHPERKPAMTVRATKVVRPLMFFSIRLSHPTFMK